MKHDSFHLNVAEFFRQQQSQICRELETLDGKATFIADSWQRPDIQGGHGGGGVSRILKSGNVFEQAGVNFSQVHGTLPAEMCAQMIGCPEPSPFYATGVSLVIHPYSPMIPTTHANFRFLQVGAKSWFGGGMDLTPYYLFPEDATHFHQTLKDACDRHDKLFYSRFKQWCDEYFYLPHRGETRGVGGVFFDYLGRDDGEGESHALFPFVKEISESFIPAYKPIVISRGAERWGEKEREFQLIRRGRYVEFNLLYDRGTLFGLKTGGRTESILMSLPPVVKWEYDFQVLPESREAELLHVLRSPRSWVSGETRDLAGPRDATAQVAE